MIAARSPRLIAGYRYEEIIQAIDWNRVLLQAKGEHLANSHTGEDDVCGTCIRSVLLRRGEL